MLDVHGMTPHMIEVRGDGAFSVNSVGLNRSAFPLTCSVREGAGTWAVSATAAQAGEVTDLLVRSASETVVIVSLETTSFWDGDHSLWAPSRIAAEQGVACRAHRLGPWAAGTPGLGEELLVLRRDDLPRFLDGSWSPYELSLVDVPAPPTAAQLDEIALAVGSAAHGEPILPRLAGSRVWYSGHDDCYIAIESVEPSVPAALFGRLLALMAGSSAAGADPVAIPEPDGAAVARLIRDSPHWIGTLAPLGNGTVVIELSAMPDRWRLGHEPPEHVDRLAVLDLDRDRWEITPAPG